MVEDQKQVKVIRTDQCNSHSSLRNSGSNHLVAALIIAVAMIVALEAVRAGSNVFGYIVLGLGFFVWLMVSFGGGK